MIKSTLYDPLLYANVIFCIGGYKELDEEYQSDCEGLQGAVILVDKKIKVGNVRDYIVWIEKPNAFYTLMHETIHLVKHIFVDRQIPFNEFNDEILAYYHAYFFKKMWHICGKHLDKDGKIKNVPVESEVGGTPADLKS